MRHCTIQINDVDLDVDYLYYPYIPATFETPAEGDDLEIIAISINGDRVQNLSGGVMEELRRKVRYAALEAIKQDAMDDGECRAEAMHNDAFYWCAS